ncbi:MAG: FkbM family methyltransferase [Candidatus Dormibacteraceae bacterium]
MEFGLRKVVSFGAYRLLSLGVRPPLAACAALIDVARLRECLKEFRINCVLDVGANEGQFASRLRRLGFRGWIISFEPNPTAFAKLQRSRSKDARWRGYQYALGSDHETRPFYLHADSSFSSFLRPLEQPRMSTVDIDVRPLGTILDKLIADISAPRIMLKMDTQGWDVEVVRGAAAVLPRITALLSELSVQPLYEGMTPFDAALGFYSDLGFTLYDITPINHRSDGTVIECDCLMVRPEGSGSESVRLNRPVS